MSTVAVKRRGVKRQSKESGAGDLLEFNIFAICPSPENDRIYRPVSADDPAIVALADNMRVNGILEPPVVTLDGYLVSGHRRYAAARLAGLRTIKCRVVNVRRSDDIDAFVKLLASHNIQREKTADEKLREAVVHADPEQSYQSLIEYRQEQAKLAVSRDTIEIVGHKSRAAISAAKRRMTDAIKRVLEDRRDYWPLSDRQFHYAMLNDPPLIHASKSDSTYRNDPASYKALTELLTRMRLEGMISMSAIADETRPVNVWNVWKDVGQYIAGEVDNFLKSYWRDLMQSQPNHVEILGEKNTLLSILKTVASEYCIPLTVGRGYCSLPPRYQMAQRFQKSGKEKLVLLVISDLDPDGESIAHSFARSMRDDFDIGQIEARKVALTQEHVQRYNLPPNMLAKESSSQFKKFAAKHGRYAYEVEAIPPAELQGILRRAIDEVIDVAAFNAELDRERQDSTFLEGVRRRVQGTLGSNWDMSQFDGKGGAE